MDCQPTRLFLLWRESFLPSSLLGTSPPSLLPSLSIPYLALPTAAAQSGRQRLKSVQDMSKFRVRGGLHMTTHTCHSTFEGCLQITAHFIITAALNHALISSFTVFSPTASKSSFGFTLVHLWERIWINSVLRFRCTSAAADTPESSELTRGLHWLQLSSFKNICFGFFFALIIWNYFETIHNGVLYVSLWSESPQVVNVLLTGSAQVLSSPHGNQIGDKEVEKLCWPSQDSFSVPVPKYYIIKFKRFVGYTAIIYSIKWFNPPLSNCIIWDWVHLNLCVDCGLKWNNRALKLADYHSTKTNPPALERSLPSPSPLTSPRPPPPCDLPSSPLPRTSFTHISDGWMSTCHTLQIWHNLCWKHLFSPGPVSCHELWWSSWHDCEG